MNALPVNCHPIVIAVDGRTSFKHDVNGPSQEFQAVVFNHEIPFSSALFDACGVRVGFDSSPQNKYKN